MAAGSIHAGEEFHRKFTQLPFVLVLVGEEFHRRFIFASTSRGNEILPCAVFGS
jgi:hypothetical protein